MRTHAHRLLFPNLTGWERRKKLKTLRLVRVAAIFFGLFAGGLMFLAGR